MVRTDHSAALDGLRAELTAQLYADNRDRHEGNRAIWRNSIREKAGWLRALDTAIRVIETANDTATIESGEPLEGALRAFYGSGS